MTEMIQTITSTDNISLLFTLVGIGYFVKENQQIKKELKEVRDQLSKQNEEVGFLRGKTETQENLSIKLEKIEALLLAIKPHSN